MANSNFVASDIFRFVQIKPWITNFKPVCQRTICLHCEISASSCEGKEFTLRYCNSCVCWLIVDVLLHVCLFTVIYRFWCLADGLRVCIISCICVYCESPLADWFCNIRQTVNNVSFRLNPLFSCIEQNLRCSVMFLLLQILESRRQWM